MVSKTNNLFDNMRQIVASGVVCMLLFAVVSCGDKAESIDPDPISPLRGTSWALIGFGDTETGTFREVERECESHFTLRFDTGYTLFAHSIENEVLSFFQINSAVGHFWIGRNPFFTEIPESDDGELFLDGLWFARSFVITARGELRLLSNSDNNYLLFGPQQPKPIDPTVSLVETSWKVAGIVNIETGILRELEQQDYLWLAFGSEIVIARSIANYLWGHYKVDYEKNSITVDSFGGTRVFRGGDNHLFERALSYMHSFVLTNNELRLYSLLPEHYRRFEWYDELNNGYLLFKPQ